MEGFDPETDLEVSRVIGASPAVVWRCLTEAALLERWFCPVPWAVRDAVIEAEPGGIFHTPMFGPDGEVQDAGPGCVLLAEPDRVLAFTDAMGPGFRPREGGFMTGVYLLEAIESGTRIVARALHGDASTRERHQEMGFEPGWTAALGQLADVAEAL
ncbi:SRPBCC domain-containing protein [Maritimibacter sp. DP1N21-5]|nr:SRPBCC domain-containing protein [Maritimibacter sp. DP1N21-5]